MAAGIAGSRLGSGIEVSTPVNPTIHKTLSDALAFLGQVERSLYEIEAALFGHHPTPTSDDAKCHEEPPIESLAIGLRTRLEELREQLAKIQGRV